jgi:hypothetical protein
MAFTLANICEEVLYEDNSNPDKPTNKWILKFKSADLLTWKDEKNNTLTNTYAFHQEK